MADHKPAANECVIYTEGFKNRIHGEAVLPKQAFGKATLLQYLNQNDTLLIERYRCYRREGLDFIEEKSSDHIDQAMTAQIQVSSISLMHGYSDYGLLSKLDDDSLANLGYQELPIFLHYVINASDPNELVYGKMLAKVASGYVDAVKARLDAIDAVLKNRPRFIAMRDPSNPLFHKWFGQEDWRGRKNHVQIPPSIVLNRRLITFFGLQKFSTP